MGKARGKEAAPTAAAVVSRAIAAAVLLLALAGSAAPSALAADGVPRTVISDDLERGRSTTTHPRIAAPNAGDGGALLPGPIFAGPRRVLVLLVKFAGDPAVPWSPSETRETVFTGSASAAAYFREESHGAIDLEGKLDPEQGDVFGWFSLDATGSGCSPYAWADEADERATASGISLAGYHHVVYVFTHRPACFWNGMATLGGNTGTAYLNGNEDVQTTAHELGHNFGLEHAGSWTCTEGGVRVPISGSCSASMYGDVFDTMGNRATRHNNGWNLMKLGLLGPAHLVTATEDGTYPLRAAFSLDPAPLILRIPRAKNAAGYVTSWYYLEVRKQGGIFENFADATMTGVSVRATASGSSPETLLIDANPATPSFADAPLQVGQTISDGTVRIGTLAAGAGTATVSVDFLALGDSEPPSTPANLAASQDAGGLRLQWEPSSDDAIVSRYVVFRNGAEIGTTPKPSFTDSSPPLGQHAYTVYAEDLAGNRSPASEPLLVTVVEPPPPAPPLPPTDPPPDVPPTPSPDSPAPGPPGPDGGKRGPLAKPVLRWERRPGGAVAFEVDAGATADVVRVSLWLNQWPLRSKPGHALRFVWKPKKPPRCGVLYRFVARANTSSGRQASSVVRLQASEIWGDAGGCRASG